MFMSKKRFISLLLAVCMLLSISIMGMGAQTAPVSKAPLVPQDLDYTENPVDIPNPDRGFTRSNDDAAGGGPWSGATSGSNKWGYMTIPASENTILGHDFQLHYEMTPPYYLGNINTPTGQIPGINTNPNAVGVPVESRVVMFYLVLNNFSSNAYCESEFGNPGVTRRAGVDGPITQYGLDYVEKWLKFIREETNSVAQIRICYDPKGWNHVVWNEDNLKYEDTTWTPSASTGRHPNNYFLAPDYTKPVAPEDREAHIAKPGVGTWRGSSPWYRNCTVPGYEELNWVEYHYKQLAPLFHEYSDVIWAFDSGTFGPWGETHSCFEAEQPGNYKKLFDTMLEMVPDGKPIMTFVGAFLDWYNRTYNTTYDFGTMHLMPKPERGTPEARFGMFDDSNGFSVDEYAWGDNGSLTEGYRMLAHDPILPGYNPNGVDPSLTRALATAPGGRVGAYIGYNDSGTNRLVPLPITLTDAQWRGVWFIDWDRTKVMNFLGNMSVYGGEQLGAEPTGANLTNGGDLSNSPHLWSTSPFRNVVLRWPSLLFEHSVSGWTYMCMEQGRNSYVGRSAHIYTQSFVEQEITYPWSGQKVQVIYDPVYEGEKVLAYYRDRMGFRFVQREGYASQWVENNGALEYEGKIQNVGWNSMFNQKDVSVLLKNKATGVVTKAVLTDIDPYDWQPADKIANSNPGFYPEMPDSRATNTDAWRDFAFSINMGDFGNLPAGEYDIYLKINDPKETTVNKRSIQFANKGDIWDEEIGANLIGSTLVVEVAKVANAKFISINPLNGKSNDTVRVVKFSATVTLSNGVSMVREYSFEVKSNNDNPSGSYTFPAGHQLKGHTVTFDIKGGGSNIKTFTIK